MYISQIKSFGTIVSIWCAKKTRYDCFDCQFYHSGTSPSFQLGSFKTLDSIVLGSSLLFIEKNKQNLTKT